MQSWWCLPFLSSWEHSQTAESKFPFPLCQKDLNSPFRSMHQSPHDVAGLPSQHRNSNSEVHRDAMREARPPLPSLPRALHCEEAAVTRDVRLLQARHGPERLRLLWGELLCLPCRFTSDTPQGILSSRLQSQPLSSSLNVSKRVKWVQQEGLKEVLLLLKAGTGTEVPQLPSGRWQKRCYSLVTQAPTRMWLLL